MTDPAKTIQVKANDFNFFITADEILAADLVQTSSNGYNLLSGHRSVNARVLHADETGKKLKIEVDGESFDIVIKDELDQVLDKMGFDKANTKHAKEIKAPMPGLVLEIAVADGQDVNQGDKILILEAMKMENSILIHTNARIKRIAVSAGQAVEKGQLLVELE